jgi:hypothetical protein
MGKTSMVLNTIEHTDESMRVLSDCKYYSDVLSQALRRKRVKLATALMWREQTQCNHAIG